MHILVVEDDPGVRWMVADLLRGSGHTVQEVSRGSEALAAFQGERFDVVLVDHSMPEMTGLEVVERLRAMGMDSPVGCITGSRGHPDVEKFASQSVPVLFKPFTVTEFTLFLERLRASRLRVSSQ